MSEHEQPSIGQALREARETQGMRQEEAAARLRLMQRQIEAMETDDFESLGQPVFARGFVRNYARLLGLAPDALLARMEGAPVELAATVRHPEPPLPCSWLSSPWLILLLLGLLIVVVAPVTLYWWLNEGEDELISQVPSTVQIDPVPLAMPEPLAEPVEAPVPADPSATESNVAPAAPVEAPVEVSTPTEGGAPAAPENLDFGGVLYLEFSGDAWVEIKDASGRMLHRQLNLAGGKVNVRGHPPFDLVIGNAAQTRLLYNGRPIDLKPFTGLSVARFTLEE